ncbi:hypothetical protein U9R90_15535 [Streptomyces sp. E11-3]|uniref:hypothetical protein n=1 Tax=Streptomyces sp. E11-3 TaxID=3110112 RepID=UPI00397F0169
MITAWSPSGAQRSRPSAIPLRLLGLGLMLLGLLYMHAASPEATVGHLRADGAVAHSVGELPGAERERQQHGGDGQQHTATAGECELGQPPSGPDVDVPCLSPLSTEAVDPAPYAEHVHHPAAVRGFVAPISHAAESPVLRI